MATLQDFPRHHERKKGAPVGVLWSFAKRDLYEKQGKKLLVYWNCNCRLNGLIFTRNTTLFSKDKPGLEGTCEMVLQLLSLYPASIFGYRQQRQDLCKLISSSNGCGREVIWLEGLKDWREAFDNFRLKKLNTSNFSSSTQPKPVNICTHRIMWLPIV